MAGAAPVKWEDEVLRKFYRSFHKHGASGWAKVARDTKMSVEQCEALHRQHTSFLSLPASQALEAAFVALVNDHYNATQKQLKDEDLGEDTTRSGRPARRGAVEPEEPDSHVASSSSQKPRRTPKPTPQRLAAEEEQQARRQARSNQGTPKSAKFKHMLKAPPSPPAGEWTSSQRKRTRRLFEDNGDLEGPRYRSPPDRWRGRHNTDDVDEGVDALLSLASGARPSALLDEGPSAHEVAASTAEPEVDEQEQEPVLGSPKRARGGRGGRTPTPTGTPLKGAARSSSATAAAAAAAEAILLPTTTGLRSPRARAAAAAAAVATTSGRGPPAVAGRQRKEQQASPTSSQKEAGDDTSPTQAGADAGDLDAGEAATTEPQDADRAAAEEGPSVSIAAGRPVRKRKPSAIAIAAAAAAEEEEGGIRGEAAVLAAVVAAASVVPGSLPPIPMPDDIAASMLEDASGSGPGADDTAALLASVPPVRTRGSTRATSNGPGSRRATDRPSPAAPLPQAPAAAVAVAVSEAEDPGDEPAGELPGAVPGRSRSTAPAEPAAPQTGARLRNLPLPGRTRQRKSRPERLPPMFESLKVPLSQPGPGSVSTLAGSIGDESTAGVAAQSADGALGPASDTAAPTGAEAESLATATGQAAAAASMAKPQMLAAEVALRHCLGTRVRRWCMYEFLYSALDRPWFMRNELMEFCMHMQLPTTKLTRLEWSVLRAALGRPRRLSLAFLREERVRLEGYREHARLKYEEAAQGMDFPMELPRQLRVGQEVTARHPISRQLHDGVILTVKGSKYRVQFHRGDLMTEVIRDTDVMPLDPFECLPLHTSFLPAMLNGRTFDAVRLAALRGLVPGMVAPPLGANLRPVGSWAAGLDTQMMRAQDAAMVAEVERALQVKEALVARLAQLNNEAASGLHTDEHGGRTERFQLQYTEVVLQLKETNTTLESALTRLQSRQQQVTSAADAMRALQPPQLAVPAAAAMFPGAGAPRVGGPVAGLPSAPSPLAQAQPQQAPAQAAPLSQSQQPQHVPALASDPSPSASVAEQQSQQAQERATNAKAPMPLPAASGNVPTLAPQPRPAVASAAPIAQALYPLPAQASPLPVPAQGLSPDHLVQQAMEEARAVVDACRNKGAETLPPQPLLLPPAPQPLPVVGPIVTMQVQAPGGAVVPLVLPPGAVMPPQLVQQQAVAVDSPQQAGQPEHLPGQQAAGANGDAAAGGGEDAAAASVQVKTEEKEEEHHRAAVVAGPKSREQPLGEEELAESWLRDVIVGCVGVLFTIQKCTAGNVPAETVADALDMAVQQLQIKTDGENEALYRDIVQSVQGLKGHLTRALA
ncbi:hypothetical protein Agub_g9269 [Astrephomene gubernaculifera]|uniref:DIRP domain-containing protein n=1 Tax=Astrephomene gubernaculifera TaxID=47775 RepID=A0AAD3DT59_9CHLO|nr:hypothetical protein Agub_g9269 [Astrephomene gubernaculifera]